MKLLVLGILSALLWLAIIRFQRWSWERRKQYMIPVQEVPLWWWLIWDIQVEYPPSVTGALVIPLFIFCVGCMLLG